MSFDLSAPPRRQERRDLRVEICWAPADTAGYLRLAKHLFPAKAVRLSRKLAARILILAPTHEQGLELIAHYGHNGNLRADYRAFVRWTVAMPGHPPVYVAFARLLRRTALVNQTHRVGRRALLFAPFDYDLYSLIARQLLQSKSHALVVRYVVKAMILAPEQAEPHITMAESAIEKAPLSVAGTAARRLQIVTADSARGFAEAVIQDSRPAIFIHIPKTAGTAALRATAPYAMPLGHRWIESAPTPRDRSYAAWVHPNLPLPPGLLRERTVFSNIRHILPFLVSFYRHARRGFAAPEMIPLVARAREYGFADFLRVIARHETPWVSRRFSIAPAAGCLPIGSIARKVWRRICRRCVGAMAFATTRCRPPTRIPAARPGNPITTRHWSIWCGIPGGGKSPSSGLNVMAVTGRTHPSTVMSPPSRRAFATIGEAMF